MGALWLNYSISIVAEQGTANLNIFTTFYSTDNLV